MNDSEPIFQFDPQAFPYPALLCNSDGQVTHTNPAAVAAFGPCRGRHVARVFPAGGELFLEFRVRGGNPSPRACELEAAPCLALFTPLPGKAFGVTVVPAPGRDAEPPLFAQMASALDEVAEGVWIVTGQGVLQYINKTAERLNAVRSAEVVGRNIRDILEEGLMDRSVSLEVIRLHRQTSFVQKIARSGKHLHVSGMPVFTSEGTIAYIVVTEKDVTDLKNLRRTVEETRQSMDKTREQLSDIGLLEDNRSDMVAVSQTMRNLLFKSLKLARFECPHVLIEGESGSGKKTLARFIHKNGRRSSGPFIHVNCAALPQALHEAEIFGYAKGAVPGGGDKGKAGMMDLAEGGSLVLEEISALGEQVQAKLLRCIQEGRYNPLGGRRPRKLNCDLIATTQFGLEPLVGRGLFRNDLFHLLNMFSLRIPPLRERPDDIGPLAEAMLAGLNKELRTNMALSPRSLELLRRQPLPGNVVELQGLLRTAVALGEETGLDEALARILLEDPRPALAEVGSATLKERLDALERDIIRTAAGACATTRELAKALGISQPSVVRKLKKYHLSLPDR